jgi:predicted NAD/FAD-dependent oxidoreductase
MGIRVVVVGDSLGGLSSALALRCVNCDVDVFERSGGAMKSLINTTTVNRESRMMTRRKDQRKNQATKKYYRNPFDYFA